MPEETKTDLANQRVTAEVRKKAVDEIIQRLELINSNDLAYILERVFIIGKPAHEFLKYPKIRDRIQSFVVENKIRHIAQVEGNSQWHNGGRFADFAHVHLDNKTYLLNDMQFVALDQTLVKEFKVSLKNANEVKF